MYLKTSIFYTTFSYIGFIPIAPGTFATIFSIPLFLIIHHNLLIYLFILLLIIILAIPSINLSEAFFQEKDSPYIVIDEVIGFLISIFSFHPQDGYLYIVLAFILFRTFDIIKPFPINVIQKLSGAQGVLLDDCLAAILTNLSLQFIHLSFKSIP